MAQEQQACFQESKGYSCEHPSCDHKRVELQIVDWSGCDGSAREESFDVSTWSADQVAALRSLVNRRYLSWAA